VDINAQNGNDQSILNSITTIVDTTTVRMMKPWFLIDWIFGATELGRKYCKAVQCVHDIINSELLRFKEMREKAENVGQNDEKPTLIELLIQYGDMKNEDIVGEISSIIGAGTDTTSTACGYVLALLGENHNIQARVMQEQQDIFGDDILRPVRSDDLPRMVYLEQVGNRPYTNQICFKVFGYSELRTLCWNSSLSTCSDSYQLTPSSPVMTCDIILLIVFYLGWKGLKYFSPKNCSI
jgi:hypothetical protein